MKRSEAGNTKASQSSYRLHCSERESNHRTIVEFFGWEPINIRELIHILKSLSGTGFRQPGTDCAWYRDYLAVQIRKDGRQVSAISDLDRIEIDLKYITFSWWMILRPLHSMDECQLFLGLALSDSIFTPTRARNRLIFMLKTQTVSVNSGWTRYASQATAESDLPIWEELKGWFFRTRST